MDDFQDVRHSNVKASSQAGANTKYKYVMVTKRRAAQDVGDTYVCWQYICHFD
jgi:hypothetical protein